MSIFVGNTACCRHDDNVILAFKAGPGGLIFGGLCYDTRKFMLEFSLWLITGQSLIPVESISLSASPSRKINQTNGEVIWDQSGNSVYVLTGSDLYFLRVEWGDLYQGNRQVTLTEFYSLFLCDRERNQQEDGSFGVNLRLMRVVSDVNATSLYSSIDRRLCLYCSSAISTATVEVTVASCDMKTFHRMSLPLPGGELDVLSSHSDYVASLSPLHATSSGATSGDSHASTHSASWGPYELCGDQNSLQVVLGYSSDCIFLLQQQGDQASEFVASSPFRLSVFAAENLHDENSKCTREEINDKSHRKRTDTTDREEYEEIDDSCSNDDDDESGSEYNCGRGCGEERGLDEECHGGTPGKILDVVCFESFCDLESTDGSHSVLRNCVFYTALLEYSSCGDTANDSSFELVCLRVRLKVDDSAAVDSFSCRIISRHHISGPTRAHGGLKADNSGREENDAVCCRLQCIHSESNVPSGVLVYIKGSIHCVGISSSGVLEAVLSDDGVSSSSPIYLETIFSLDIWSSISEADCEPNVCFTIASNLLLVTSSCTGKSSSATAESSCADSVYSYIHSVSLLLSQTLSSDLVSNSQCGISKALLDMTAGVILFCDYDECGGVDNMEDMTYDIPQKYLRSESGRFAASDAGVSFKRVGIPSSLQRDIIYNGCRFKLLPKDSGDYSTNFVTQQVIAMKRLMRSRHHLGGGLKCATVRCNEPDKRGYIAFVVSVSPVIANFRLAGTSSSFSTHCSYIWVQSTVTSKWKVLRNPDELSVSSVCLITYRKPSLLNDTHVGKVFPSRRLYTEGGNDIVGILNIGWFEEHSVFMCTIRKQACAHHSPEAREASTHCCLELMSRASDLTESVTVEHNKFRNGRRDLRRLSAPNVHRVIPLPTGFVPVIADICCVLPDYSLSSRKSRATSVSSTGVDAEMSDIDPVTPHAACILLLGNSSGHFIAFQVEAVGTFSSSGSNPILNIFKPTRYLVSLMWQCDLSSPLASLSVDPHDWTLQLPLRSAHVLVSDGSIDACKHPNDIGMLVLDKDGRVIKIQVYSDGCAEMSASSGDSKKYTNNQSGDYRIFSTFICSGKCVNLLRVKDHNNGLESAHSSLRSLNDNLFLLTSFSGDDDMLYLVAPHGTDGQEHGRVMRAPFRNRFDAPIDSINYIGGFALRCYNQTCDLGVARSASSPMHKCASGGAVPRLISCDNEEYCPLSLFPNSLLVLLALVMGMLNIKCLPPSPFASAILIPAYQYQHSTVDIVRDMIASLRRCSGTLLLLLANGVESHLKSIIQRSNFTRHTPEFAVITSVLFAADDMFFIDVFSKLSRKLEPHVSSKLFPLPNCQLSYITNLGNGACANMINSKVKRKYVDSFWNQLSLFELCLNKRWLNYASRLLTIACEHLGGPQSLETITACLTITTELLFESLTCMSMATALECLDFCVRLDMMALELIAQNDASVKEIQKSEEASSRAQVVNFVQKEVIGMMDLLSPLLGSDLHDVLQDAVEPRNVRNCIGLRLYNQSLYLHPKLKFRLEKSDSPGYLSFGSSNHKYFAFCASNSIIQEHIQSRLETQAASDFNADFEPPLQQCSLMSYSCTVLQQVVTKLMSTQQWLSASVIMNSIQQHLLASSKSRVSWVEEYLYYNSIDMLIQQANSRESFENCGLIKVIRDMDLQMSLKMSPSCPLDHVENSDIRNFLIKELQTLDVRRRCEKEAATVASGALEGTRTLRTFDLFCLAEASAGVISMLDVLRGAACASILTGHIEVILFISILLGKKEIAEACLLWDVNNNYRMLVIDFFLSRQAQREEPLGGERVKLTAEGEVLIEMTFGSSLISIQSIAEEIYHYYFCAS
mmetsp:Transcript_22522/g.38147  ORF Transcript_22522/g.38147 Transcript_22522/m.38147 type:complete len:1837 (-) Transcript_22522:3343-8853(-)|eukprot:CAMPEP_0114419230 /NCGR_PEP_ID=MMETSP0103-20121206/3917_1 /TAXON_ID=37642 ORGANISM="Paraphysomonas imperforata, Strain PA2" /NCGR_SAMPLE_ID=MMETSP0103 /ASSEMBLY_ACC=CAM_ASM_000201 /LENGTH=1836 /DNA_ID=CAMNT_0001587637 /DNA_START=121 /DNA_END=5631 /DNA_ORIENTATION=+